MSNKYIQLTNYGCENIKPEDEVIYLNKGCLSFSEIYDLKNKKSICLDCSSMINKTEIDKIWNQFFDKIWDNCGVVLSDYHKVEHNAAYWKYLVSYDFPPFIMLYYERYINIKNAINKHYGTTIRLYEINDDFYIAKQSIWDFENLSLFVQKIDGQILEFLEYPFIEKISVESMKKKEDKSYTVKKNNNTLKSFCNKIYNIISRNCYFFITYSVAARTVKFKLNNVFKVFYNYKLHTQYRRVDFIDNEIRVKIFSRINIKAMSEFENIFLSNLWKNMSNVYIEDYKKLCDISRPYYFYHPRVFIKLFYEEPMMEYAASLIENGKKVVNCSHSIEESFRLYRSKTDELSACSLDWANSRYYGNKRNKECISYMMFESCKVDYMKNESILYVCAGGKSRYNLSWNSFGICKMQEEEKYVRKPVDLYNLLKEDVKEKIIFRSRDDWKYGIREFIGRECKGIRFDDGFLNRIYSSFAQKMRSTRIAICETVHSTSFFQVLLYDIPAIIIEDIEEIDYSQILSQEIINLFDKLRKVDVIVKDGVRAAEIINSNYEDIDKWWNEPSRHSVVEETKAVWSDLNFMDNSKAWKIILNSLKK